MSAEKRGERLAEFRRAKKLTGLQLAEKLGVTSGAMSGYEKGSSFPKPEKLEALAEIGLNLHWFITGVGPMLISELETSKPMTKAEIAELVRTELAKQRAEEATARKTKAKPASINGAHIKA